MVERMNFSRATAIGVIALCAACSSKPQQQQPATRTDSSAPIPMLGGAPGSPGCPATGLWDRCSVLYRLDRAGIAPHIDSTDKIEETSLTGKAFAVKFGVNSRLELFLYPDSASRVADAAKLDRAKFVGPTAPQTMNRERTLIENGNLIGLLTSLNDRLRERVSDALSAGAPQPPAPVTVR
jgi:hypothetical protein